MQTSSATKDSSGRLTASNPAPGSTTEQVTPYHWIVVILAACGWLFDCMGQRIFVLAREPALRELLGSAASDAAVKYWGGVATFILMIGWATGGIFFGMMSDRYGRVKVMVAALMAYTVFSGVSGFARGVTDFLVYRFLFGLGVGGMFGAATTLVAESVPPHFRTVALGSMQALSACGNMLASGLSIKIVPGQESFWGHFSGWQVLFFAGVAPAILGLPMMLILKEPELWKRAKAEAAKGGAAGKSVGSITDLFRHPRWRRSTLVGICLGLSGMVGLWGIAFFSPELISTAFKNRPLLAQEIAQPNELCAALNAATNAAIEHVKSRLTPAVVQQVAQVHAGSAVPPAVLEALRLDLDRLIHQDELYHPEAFQAAALRKGTTNLVHLAQKNRDPQDIMLLNRQLLEQTFPGAFHELQKAIQKTRSRGTLLQDLGALFGMFTFTFVAAWFNRRTAFLAAFSLCLVVVSFVFYSLKTAADAYWMLPLMGFATLSVFAGYSIYFPEIFPTRLRGTGVGFCYNTVRYLAAPFPLLLGFLSTHMPFRTVAVIMSSIYLLGVVALIWAPETKGQPLPED